MLALVSPQGCVLASDVQWVHVLVHIWPPSCFLAPNVLVSLHFEPAFMGLEAVQAACLMFPSSSIQTAPTSKCLVSMGVCTFQGGQTWNRNRSRKCSGNQPHSFSRIVHRYHFPSCSLTNSSMIPPGRLSYNFMCAQAINHYHIQQSFTDITFLSCSLTNSSILPPGRSSYNFM